MQFTAPFTVLKASAGAGKTYSLVLSYLKICLQSESPLGFMKILAITFTNKAAAEMKERIMETLAEISTCKARGENSMLDTLCAELQEEPGVLAERAALVMRHLLHAYSAFSVSTIDTFTNRLIRSFAYDLRLNGNYEVEIDGKAMLKEAVEKMVESTSAGDELTKVLLQYLKEKLDKGNSPRIEKDLIDFGGQLFHENAQPHITKLGNLSLSQMLYAHEQLNKRKSELETTISEGADGLLNLLAEHNIEHHWFSRGSLPKWLINCRDKVEGKRIPSPTLIKQIMGEQNFIPKSKEKEVGSAFDGIRGQFEEELLNFYHRFQEVYAEMHLISSILKNFYGFTVLHEINDSLQTLKEETNRLPIGEFNKLISERLQQQAAPFLFERLGDKYQHFFIDEFQDTSVLQWNNLTPLINNALSEGKGQSSAMLVGDGKQAIYRWRGGDVQQFINLSNNTHPSNKVNVGERKLELYARDTVRLEHNYRSLQNIVEFNNAVFEHVATELSNEQHQQLYADANQKPKGKPGGYVRLEIGEYEKGVSEGRELEQAVEAVRESKAAGYAYKDIAILVRKTTEIDQLNQYFLEQEEIIPTLTTDSLLLSQSADVDFVIQFLRLIDNPVNKRTQALVASFLWEAHKPLQANLKHLFLNKIKEEGLSVFKQILRSVWGDFALEEFDQLSLLNKVYEICNKANLPFGEDAFLSAFIDEVKNFENNKGSDTSGFLDWWETLGSGKKLSMSEGPDAVQIFTIHKSKGLEFPVVIVPFADWIIDNKKQRTAWMSLEPEAAFGLESALISLNAKDGFEGEAFGAVVESEIAERNLDSANLLYVAFTRAEQALIAFTSRGKRDRKNRVSLWLEQYLEKQGIEEKLEIGTLKKVEEEHTETPRTSVKIETLAPQKFQREDWKDKLNVSINAPKQWQPNAAQNEAMRFGAELHEILSTIEYAQNWNPESVAEEHRVLISEVLKHPELSGFYSNQKVEVLNERDVLVPNGKLQRPDRVVLEGNTVHIIDYKTGAFHESHKQQVAGYATLLKGAGFENGELKLVYLGEKIEVINV